MTEKLQQIAKEEIEKLPQEAQEAITSLDWGGISEEIGLRYLVLEENVNDLQTEVLLVLVGLEEPGLFQIHLENNLGATSEEAKRMSEEAFQKIFLPVSQKMQENIKKSGKVESAAWHKNIDFILSGGNFLVFLQAPAQENKL